PFSRDAAAPTHRLLLAPSWPASHTTSAARRVGHVDAPPFANGALDLTKPRGLARGPHRLFATLLQAPSAVAVNAWQRLALFALGTVAHRAPPACRARSIGNCPDPIPGRELIVPAGFSSRCRRCFIHVMKIGSIRDQVMHIHNDAAPAIALFCEL